MDIKSTTDTLIPWMPENVDPLIFSPKRKIIAVSIFILQPIAICNFKTWRIGVYLTPKDNRTISNKIEFQGDRSF